MAGNRAGGLKAAQTNRKRHGADFYADIGTKGGKLGHTGGFAHDKRTWLQKLLRKPKLASLAGKAGGRISKRKKKEV